MAWVAKGILEGGQLSRCWRGEERLVDSGEGESRCSRVVHFGVDEQQEFGRQQDVGPRWIWGWNISFEPRYGLLNDLRELSECVTMSAEEVQSAQRRNKRERSSEVVENRGPRAPATSGAGRGPIVQFGRGPIVQSSSCLPKPACSSLWVQKAKPVSSAVD